MLVPQNSSQNTIEKYTFRILNGGLEKYLESVPALDQMIHANNLSHMVPRVINRDRSEVVVYVAYEHKVDLLNLTESTAVFLRDMGIRRVFTDVEKIQGASVTARKLLEYERELYREALAA